MFGGLWVGAREEVGARAGWIEDFDLILVKGVDGGFKAGDGCGRRWIAF